MGSTPIIGVVNVNREMVNWELYAVSLVRGLDAPYNYGNILLPKYVDSSVDVNTESSVTVDAAIGTTSTGSVSVDFILDDKRSLVLEGTLLAFIPIEIILSSVDATYSGTVEAVSISVSLDMLGISTGTVSTIVSDTKNLGVSISGTASASKSWTEVVSIDVPRTVFGGDNLLRLNLTLDVSATTDASATTATEGIGKLIYDGSMRFWLPVV